MKAKIDNNNVARVTRHCYNIKIMDSKYSKEWTRDQSQGSKLSAKKVVHKSLFISFKDIIVTVLSYLIAFVMMKDKSTHQEKVARARSIVLIAGNRIRLYQYNQSYLRGLFYGLLSIVPRFRGRVVAVKKLKGHAPIYIRIGTTDIDVFDEVFRRGTYSFPLAKVPSKIIDGGSNIGLTSIYFSLLYPRANIIAVEPDPENFKLLVRNCATYPNIKPVQAAIWNKPVDLKIEDPGEGAWSYRVNQTKGNNISKDRNLVKGVTIADLINKFNIKEISILKLDIEGSEKEVFEDASDWIDSVKTIMVELHDRFKPGCSDAFFSTVKDFPVHMQKELTTFVARPGCVI